MNRKRILNFLKYNLWIMILDIVFFNLAYYLALYIRFVVNGTFRESVSYYLTDWISFAPYYTVLALAVFLMSKLYGGKWKFAGLNDMNRIILANAATALIMIVGTLIFIRRMPITFYGIGALLQLFMTAAIRFVFRFVLEEKKRLTRTDTVPVLVIGSGELGQKVIRYLDEGGVFQPVEIIGGEEDTGRTLNRIPVASFDSLENSMKKVQAVFIADKSLTPQQREAIRQAAGERKIFDYTGLLSNMTGAVPLTGLLEAVPGAVTIRSGGQEQKYDSGREALRDLHDRYLVTGIRGENLTIELEKDDGLAYLRQHQEETGEEMSFF